MIFLEMFGNGVQIGMIIITINSLKIKLADNPIGPSSSYDPNEPYLAKKVMRGGSFLCNESYCSGYRNSMRMKTTPDTSSIHAGFRTVVDAM